MTETQSNPAPPQPTEPGAQEAPDEGRRRHYGQFYGLAPLPDRGLPRLVVFGNCLAEALRVSLDSHDHAPDLDTVRIPPVHELTAEDLPHLNTLLAGTDLLIAQPVRADYRDLPLGTDQVRALLPAGAQVVLFPSVRDNAAHPYQALVHGDGLVDPPLVPYHDLRLIAETAGLAGGPSTQTPEQRADGWRQIAASSVAEMEQRAQKQGTITLHDVVADHPGQFWTLNHPNNHLVLTLAQRVRDQLGLDPQVLDPGRVMLGSVRTPVDAEVVAALGLDREPSEQWLVDGHPVTPAQVRAAHQEFYAASPQVISSALEVHAERLSTLGWRV